MTRAGFAAVVGAPNSGKSTLVNRLVGQKVSIVTRKVQTTRFPVRGVAAEGESQIVLVDTPGLFKPRRRLDRAMVGSAIARAREADAVVHVVDAHAAEADEASALPSIPGSVPVLLALNKIDLVRRELLLPLAERLFAPPYRALFMISALTGSGVADLKAELARLMPEGPWLYPEDQAADLPARLLAAEITREQLYERAHQEVPYAAGVETTAFTERKDGSVRIEQTIFVEREGQKAILIGKGGQALKQIGSAARREIGRVLQRPCHLFLTVKAEPGWAEKASRLAAQGVHEE